MEITLEKVSELTKKYGAWQHPVEFYELIKILSNNPPKTFLEIGSWGGGFGAVLKCFFPDIKLISVDLINWQDPLIIPPNTQENMDLLKKNVIEFGINFVVGNSRDQETLDKALEILGGEKIDFLFIDGAHDYGSVKHDFEMWSPYAKMVGFHDLWNDLGPLPLWREIKDKYKTEEIRAEGGMGIGVLHV